MQAALFATFCALYCEESMWFCLLPLVMYARVHFGCHYFSDTVVGAGMGIVTTVLCRSVIQRVLVMYAGMAEHEHGHAIPNEYIYQGV